MNKKCYFCGKSKKINRKNFGIDKSRPNGYRDFCKNCGKAWDKYYEAIRGLQKINPSFKMKGKAPYTYDSMR